jgi:thioesterase domain-containing protein
LARGVDGHEEPLTSIEGMAEYCISAMRSVQSNGPYAFGGYCIGGIIAFEMARQLEGQGQQIALVAVLEGHAPLKGNGKVKLRQIANFMRNLPYWFREYLHMGGKQMLARFVRVARITGKQMARRFGADIPVTLGDILDDISDIPQSNREFMEKQVRAQKNYFPQLYSGPITLFRVQAQSFWTLHDPALGWNQLTSGGVEIKMIAGSHHDILELPFVRSLAEQLKVSLEQAETRL